MITETGSRTVPNAFRAVVERHGERCALEADDGAELTYAELDRLSNRVAHGLLERGGDAPVAMVAPLEPTSVVAMLGALKAGRVFVPLDPRDPPENVRLVREQLGALMLSADTLDDFSADRDDDPMLWLDPEQRSLVYFTSGSSGRPKGTIKSHRQLARAPVADGIAAEDRFAIILPLAFAASMTPVFATLLAGATGCFFDPITHSIGSLAAWLDSAGITALKTSPSALGAIAKALEERDRRAPSVRLAIIGGEPCEGKHLEVVRRVLPAAVIVNHYGSTEAGRIATTAIQPGERLDPGPIPFRRIPDGQSVEIVDETGRRVPVGEMGEILVRGNDVSLGYWEEPEGPGPRFVHEEGGVRSIRTGDRGRIRPDGALEHLGRADVVVKVHGQTVDPGAVEHALASLPGVVEAVVSAVAGHDGDTRLVAHVLVDARPYELTRRDLRVGLATKLPAFMIPSTFVLVDSIPRTERGKVDREALRRSALAVVPRQFEYVAPRDPTEYELATVVAEILGLERVGVRDDVFELGLDSLSATELLAAIGDRFDLELVAADLIESPTVGALAIRVRRGATTVDRTIAAVSERGTGTPFFCVLGHGATLLVLRSLALRIDRPTYSFVPRGLERRAFPDRTIERVAARYLEALREVQPSGPYLIAGYSIGALFAYELAQQLRSAGEDVGLLVLVDPTTLRQSYGRRARQIVAGTPVSRAGRIARARRLAHHASLWLRYTVEIPAVGLATRSPATQLRVFIAMGRRLSKRYRPEPYDGPALLLRTEGWTWLDELDISKLLTGESRVVDVPGSHTTIFREPHVARLAAELREALALADPTG